MQFLTLDCKVPSRGRGSGTSDDYEGIWVQRTELGGFFFGGEGLYMQGKPSMGDGRYYKVK